MPLVLHPSSRCDVCLDSYTLQTISHIPHVIPCGHVFCRPCLFTLNPEFCPLCREEYETNELNKLHVDRPENIDENRESILLQRLAVYWDAPEAQLEQIKLEVDTWLETRADEACIVLRKARAALERLFSLEEAELTYQSDLTNIQTCYNDMVVAYDAERRKAVATETRLKAEINTLIRKVTRNEDLEDAETTLQSDLTDIRTRETKFTVDNNALRRENKELKKEKITLQNDLTDIQRRYIDMVTTYDIERRKAVATETKLEADNNALIREVNQNEDRIKKAETTSHNNFTNIHIRHSDMMVAEHQKAETQLTQLKADNNALIREVSQNEDLKGKLRAMPALGDWLNWLNP